MDLILFPKAQGICVTALIDMWAELHQLDDDGRVDTNGDPGSHEDRMISPPFNERPMFLQP